MLALIRAADHYYLMETPNGERAELEAKSTREQLEAELGELNSSIEVQEIDLNRDLSALHVRMDRYVLDKKRQRAIKRLLEDMSEGNPTGDT